MNVKVEVEVNKKVWGVLRGPGARRTADTHSPCVQPVRRGVQRLRAWEAACRLQAACPPCASAPTTAAA